MESTLSSARSSRAWTLKRLRAGFLFFSFFFFFFYGKGWVEFGYIVFGLNGVQWFFS